MKNTISLLIYLALVITTLISCQLKSETSMSNPAEHSTPMQDLEDQPYYQLVLIWVKDPVMFSEYATEAAPIVGKYGGQLDKMFAPTAIYAEGMDQPHIVNLVHYASKAAFEQLEQDEAYKAIVHLRDESIEMKSFEGYLSQDQATNEGLDKRMYNVEIASFKDRNTAPYTRYETEGEAAMARYGYQVEYVLDIEEGHPSGSDFAKISFWNNEEGLKNFESDEMHHKIETELYPPAVENLIWISAKVHPGMLQD